MKARTFLLTTLTLIAFASNSLLCRAALKQTGIDAATFTSVRILSGAAALWIVMQFRRMGANGATQNSTHSLEGNWLSALALFVYAAGFSFAYNSLSAGTGALLLFGAVQATMIFWGIRQGERLRLPQIAGLIVAVAGLVILLIPGLSAPPIGGSLLMLGAGLAWGIYSLRGKTTRNATAATAGNFVRAVPLALVASIATLPFVQLDGLGLVYAIISGTITSGLGYIVWYSVLSDSNPMRLGPTSAATVQLSVPVLAATGGILFLREPITLRYLLACLAVLGGIFLVVIEKKSPNATGSLEPGQT